MDGWSLFDISLIFGGGPGPFTYSLWFSDGGTVKFDRDVILSYQGTSEKSLYAGETVTVNESFSEYALTFDDGNSIITPQGVTVHQHMVPTGIENNMIFDSNVPTNYTIFEGGGEMIPNGHPGHATVGTPPALDGPYMQWYGTIYGESDPRYRFGANPASSLSNEGTFASWISKWSLKNRP